ncbi:MAG: recombinase family protein [Planctomycetia bacterium]
MPARRPGEARCYLRRSSAKQESSLEMQLEYVLTAAKQHGVRLRASLADLAHMQAKRLTKYKDIFLDDAVSGTRTKRPAFDAMIAELKAEPSVSHLFVHKRDRLGRPRSPLSMMVVEEDLKLAGVTIVTSEGVIAAGARGPEALGQSLTSLVGYYESGEFSRKLSERVVTKHIELATQGYSTGGIPPYGFGRFLEKSDGTLVEIPMHQRHTERNCHIRFLPNDEQRIKTWIWMLERLEAGWSTKRVAQRLNELGIPTRDAGRTRHDNGVEHEVSGKWHESTVHALATNPIIIGVKQYGRYSEGVHHRAQSTGFRPVTEDELLLDGSGKTIENDVSDRIRAAAGFAAQFDPERWHRLQDNLKARGSSQRGKRKAHDPAAYPLTPCVFDLTCSCGGIMHGVVRKDRGVGRPVYRCSIYTKTQGAKRNHNNIDAEALLQFTARTLVALMRRAAGRDKLRATVVARIREMQKAPPTADEAIREEMFARVERLRQKVAQAPKRILEEDDDDLRAALRAGFRELQAELTAAEKALADAEKRMPHREPPASVEAEVEKAMALMDRIETVCTDPAAREELNRLVQDLGLRIGLTFREGRRNNRPVRVLQGGIVAFGNRPLPCTLRNSSGRPLAGGLPEVADDEQRDNEGGGQHRGHTKHPGEAERSAAGSRKAPSDRKGGSAGSRRTSRGGVRHSPADRQSPRQPSETGRLYKASRGDPRRAFPDEAAPSQNAREISRSLPVPLPVPDLVRRGCGAGEIGISA